AIGRFLDANAGVLAEFLDHVLAVIAQGRGIAAGGFHFADLLIELGNVAGQPVDLAGHRHALALEGVELGADVVVQAVEALRQLFGFTDDLLTQGDGFRRRAGFAERGEEVVQADADAGAFAVDQAFQRRQILLVGAEVALVGAGTPQLLVVEVAGQAADAGHLDTATDAGCSLSAERMLLGRQAAEAGRVDVGDVLRSEGTRLNSSHVKTSYAV